MLSFFTISVKNRYRNLYRPIPITIPIRHFQYRQNRYIGRYRYISRYRYRNCIGRTLGLMIFDICICQYNYIKVSQFALLATCRFSALKQLHIFFLNILYRKSKHVNFELVSKFLVQRLRDSPTYHYIRIYGLLRYIRVFHAYLSFWIVLQDKDSENGRDQNQAE